MSKRLDLSSLEEIEVQTAKDLEKRRKRKRYPRGKTTRIAAGVRTRSRLPPPVPEGASLEDIRQMDPEDPAFRHARGRKRKNRDPKDDSIPWKEAIREHRQRKAQGRRAKVRRWEAEVTVAAENYERRIEPKAKDEMELYDEDRLIEDGALTLDDWDNEELARGYRRNRRGKFGPPPKYIAREVQQEAFRRLVKRGERKLKEAYIHVVEELVQLAYNAGSEKVRLEAQKEIMNRLVGKVPEHLKIGPDEKWMDYLADTLEPVEFVPPIEVEAREVPPDEVDAPSVPQRAATGEGPDDGEVPSSGGSNPKKRKSGVSKRKSGVRKKKGGK